MNDHKWKIRIYFPEGGYEIYRKCDMIVENGHMISFKCDGELLQTTLPYRARRVA